MRLQLQRLSLGGSGKPGQLPLGPPILTQSIINGDPKVGDTLGTEITFTRATFDGADTVTDEITVGGVVRTIGYRLTVADANQQLRYVTTGTNAEGSRSSTATKTVAEAVALNLVMEGQAGQYGFITDANAPSIIGANLDIKGEVYVRAHDDTVRGLVMRGTDFDGTPSSTGRWQVRLHSDNRIRFQVFDSVDNAWRTIQTTDPVPTGEWLEFECVVFSGVMGMTVGTLPVDPSISVNYDPSGLEGEYRFLGDATGSNASGVQLRNLSFDAERDGNIEVVVAPTVYNASDTTIINNGTLADGQVTDVSMWQPPASGEIVLDASIVADPPLAVNLTQITSFNETPAYLDRVRQSNFNALLTTENNWQALSDGGYLGSSGWPTTLPAGETTLRIGWEIAEGINSGPGGEERFLRLVSGGNVITEDQQMPAPEPGGTLARSVYAIQGNNGETQNSSFVITHDNANPVTSFSFIPEAYENEHNAGELFDPRHILIHKPWRLVRYMPWSLINGEIAQTCRLFDSQSTFFADEAVYNPADQKIYLNATGGTITKTTDFAGHVAAGDFVLWDCFTRTFEGHFDRSDDKVSQSIGEVMPRVVAPDSFQASSIGAPVPLSHMIAHANACRVDAWFTFTPFTNLETWKKALHKIKTDLDPDLKVYIELGNETSWNFGFRLWHYYSCKTQGDWGVGAAASPYFAKDATLLAKAAAEVFADDRARLINVMPVHLGNPNLTSELLEAPFWLAAEPDEWIDPMTVFDAVAPTVYFGTDFSGQSDQYDLVLARGAFAGWTETQIFDEINVRMLDPARDRSIPSIGNLMDLHAAQAKGLPLIPYEGGQHTFQQQSGGDWNALTPEEQNTYNQRMIDYVRSPQMGVLYLEWLAMCEAKINGPAMQYKSLGTADRFGHWGLQQTWNGVNHPGVNSDRAQNFKAYNEEVPSNRWWPETVPPGTYEAVARIVKTGPIAAGTVLTVVPDGVVSGVGSSPSDWQIKRLSNGSVIGNGSGYTLQPGDAGDTYFADLAGTDYRTGPVVWAVAASSYTPTLSIISSTGAVQINPTTTAAYPKPLRYDFVWRDAGTPIPGATDETYLGATDVAQLTVTFKEWTSAGPAVEVTSAAINYVAPVQAAGTIPADFFGTYQGAQTLDATPFFINEDGGVWSLVNAPSGFTITQAGLVQFNTTTIGALEETTIQIQVVKNGITATQNYTVTINIYTHVLDVEEFVAGQYGYWSGGSPTGNVTPLTLNGKTFALFSAQDSNNNVRVQFTDALPFAGITTLRLEMQGYADEILLDAQANQYARGMPQALIDYFISLVGSRAGFNFYDNDTGEQLDPPFTHTLSVEEVAAGQYGYWNGGSPTGNFVPVTIEGTTIAVFVAVNSNNNVRLLPATGVPLPEITAVELEMEGFSGPLVLNSVANGYQTSFTQEIIDQFIAAVGTDVRLNIYDYTSGSRGAKLLP